MNAVLLIVGLALLGQSGPPLPTEGIALPEPGPLPAGGPAVPAPLPQVQGAGLLPAAEPTPPALPAADFVPTPAPAAIPPAPERTPAFRPVKPEQPEAPPPAPPAETGGDMAPRQPGGLRPGMQTPTVAVDKIGPAEVQAGVSFTYDVLVRNVGSAPALRILLEDEIPVGTRVLSAEPAPLVQENRLIWQIEALAPGEVKTFHVRAQPATGGPWVGAATVIVSASSVLQARARGSPAPPTPAPAPAPVPAPVRPPAPVTPPPGGPMVLDLRGPSAVVVQGHPLAFELRVTNRGAATIVGVLLHAHLPPGLEHFYGSDIELNLDPLGPGEGRTEKLEVIATRPGRHVAEVSVRARGMAPVVARAPVAVRDDPVLGLRLVGPREAWVGHAAEFRLEVTNRAPVAARDVVVLQRLPAGVAVAGGAVGASYDADSRTLRWRAGTLAPGQTRTVSFKLLTRATGPALHDITARTAGGHEARLQTVLKFWPQQGAAGRLNNR